MTKRILFTTSAAPLKSAFSTSEKRPPLGLGSLISLCRNNGHQVFFIDNYLKPSSFIEEGFLQQNKIDFVGIYSNTICFEDTLRMVHAIDSLRKEKKWTGKIAVGGPHAALAPETLPDFVDYVVRGEGELILPDILDEKTTTRILTGPKVKDMDSLPFQPWDLFASMSYDFTCPWMEGQPIFTLNTSRGCPFKCRFCSVGSVWGRHYTYFSPRRIIDEIDLLIRQYGAKGIYFREDNFTLNEKRTRGFCELMIQKGWGISWACETRVDNLTGELVELMAKAGCRALYLGIESGSQRMLDLLEKGITVEQIENTVKWGKEFNINCYCSLITGIPGETITDYRETVRLMKKIKPYRYSFNVFVGLPDSPLYRDIRDKKLYEYKASNGLLYLPGFDIKTEYFYGYPSSEFLDYSFKKRTWFDRYFQVKLFGKKVRRLASHFLRNILGVKKRK